jgi:predicted nucleic acid-binding protein
LSHLTARGLLLGTSKYTVNAIHEELDFMGASLNASVGKDVASLSLRILKKDLEKGFDLFMEALRRPAFPEEEIRREIEKTLAAIQSEEDEPGEVAEKEFQKVKKYLDSQRFYELQHPRESFAAAAHLYLRCRRRGMPIGSTLYCLIAQTAVENRLFLLHNDSGFDRIARFIDLKIFSF